MLHDYIPVLLQFAVAAGFAAVTIALSTLLGRKGVTSSVKDSAYECGMLVDSEAQPRFSVKFYLVAMLFVLFDIEVVFLYPWAVVFREFVATQGPSIFWAAFGFIGILAFAYVYALKKRALEWAE